ncbi:MAG: hypothetical protein ACC651_11300 [Candidatus Scalindua sp.]
MNKKLENKLRLSWPLWISLSLGVALILLLLLHIVRPIVSNDIWWHIALGKHILESGSFIVDHSIFSWTPAAAYSTYNAWLGEIFFYFVDKLFGVGGLLAVRFAIFFLLFFLGWSYAVKRDIARHPLTWAIILLSLALVFPSYAIKPGLLTLGFMTIVVWLYFWIRSTGESARFLVYIFPLILLVWVNTHGGFFLVAPFFLLIAIGEVLNRKFSPRYSMTPLLQKHLLFALILCVGVVFVTPFGYEMPFDIIKLILKPDNYFIGRIAEYRPTYALNSAPYYFLDYLILAMLIFIFLIFQQLKNGKADWVVILIFIAYSGLFVQMSRTTYFLGPVFLFVGLDLLANKDSSWAWSNSVISKFILTIASVGIFSLIGWRSISNNQCVRLQDMFSQMLDIRSYSISVEAEYIAENIAGKRIGNFYDDGGYLIYRLWPDKKVMIDPRSFPYDDWIKQYFEEIGDGKNIPGFISEHPADFWLVRYEDHIIFDWFYKSSDWGLSFLGPNAGIFEPESSKLLEPAISSEVEEMFNFWGIINALNTSLKINNLKFSRKLQKAVSNNLHPTCPRNKNFLDEVDRSIKGFEAFNAGDYKLATELLGKEASNLHISVKAVQSYFNLAVLAFNAKEYYKARDLIAKTFPLIKVKVMEDIYNMAVTDWHYRRSNTGKIYIVDDELRWEELVQLIIENKRLVPKNQSVILKTAIAMKEGRYIGGAKLIPRRTE